MKRNNKSKLFLWELYELVQADWNTLAWKFSKKLTFLELFIFTEKSGGIID